MVFASPKTIPGFLLELNHSARLQPGIRGNRLWPFQRFPAFMVRHNNGWGGRIRTYGSRNQNPVTYHLSTPHQWPS